MTIDYEGATKLAHEVLIKYSDGTLPIDIFKIIKENFKNITIMSFSKWKKKTKSTGNMIDLLKTDYGIAFYDGNKYCIIYNDNKCLQTQRWTVSHELGHILKGHVIDDNYLRFSLDSNIYETTDNFFEMEINPYEAEANTFAKHLLAPFPIIKHLFNALGRNTIYSQDIEDIFDIGPWASENIIKHLNNLYYYPTNHDLENKFEQTLHNLKNNIK